MFFKRDILLAQEYLGFLLLNMFDLFLTGYLLHHHGQEANGQEANGLAGLIYAQHGPFGLALYKFSLVMIVVLACEGISLKNVRTSRIIVTAGCLVYLLIVFWEVFLAITQLHGIHR